MSVHFHLKHIFCIFVLNAWRQDKIFKVSGKEFHTKGPLYKNDCLNISRFHFLYKHYEHLFILLVQTL